MRLIFVGQGYPRKLFNLEHFPIYGIPRDKHVGTCGSGILGNIVVLCDNVTMKNGDVST